MIVMNINTATSEVFWIEGKNTVVNSVYLNKMWCGLGRDWGNSNNDLNDNCVNNLLFSSIWIRTHSQHFFCIFFIFNEKRTRIQRENIEIEK